MGYAAKFTGIIISAFLYICLSYAVSLSYNVDCKTFGYSAGLKGIDEYKIMDLAQIYYENFQQCVLEAFELGRNFYNAEKAYRNKDYVTALNLFLKNAKEGDIMSQLKVADLYSKGVGTARDDRESFQWYKAAAEKGSTKGWYKVGLAYRNGTGTEKNFDKAIEALKKAVEKDTGNYKAWGYLALCYKEKGDYGNALQSIGKAIALSPENPDLNRIQAEIYLTSSDINNSKKWYEKALELLLHTVEEEPSATYYLDASRCALYVAKFKDSEMYAKDGLSIDSKSYELRAILGHAYLFQKMKTEALHSYKMCIEPELEKPVAPCIDILKGDFFLLRKLYPEDIPLIEWAETKLRIAN